MVPIEVDEAGAILDGHHRKQIADKHGLQYQTITRTFQTEAEKIEHIVKINMARRHLAPHEWGQAFKLLLESKGVKRGQGGDRKSTDAVSVDTVKQLATDTGVDERTARRRLAAADKYDKLPKAAQKAVDAGTATLADAIRETKRKKIVADLDDIATRKIKKASGLYDVIVIDPPWPIKKIERDCRPNQSELDYPTMTEQQLTKLKIPRDMGTLGSFNGSPFSSPVGNAPFIERKRFQLTL